MTQVVCVGVITMDTIALVDHYPGADERVLARGMARNGGGPAAVASVAMARLGIDVAIVGTVGNDSDGREVLTILEREGVDTSGVTVDLSVRTAGSVIVVSGHSRSIATLQRPTQATPSAHAAALARTAEWVHVDHVGVEVLSALGVTRGSGPLISFDAGYEVVDFDCARVDLFAPTDRQMALRHPDLSLVDALRADQAHGRNLVVATRGSEGSIGLELDGTVAQAPGFKIDVLSTLGAGDVFHGALVAQMIEGRSLRECLVRANAVAALKCRGLDAQSAIPTATELDIFLKEQGVLV
jgi:sulfofructose kinase